MPVASSRYSLRSHFDGREPDVRASYERLLEAARRLGPVEEESKKTSIHLVRRTAFAGVATRKTGLVLTLKLESTPKSQRIRKREQTSANRWHIEVLLERPAEVDRELKEWLEQAYQLSS